MIGRFIGRGSLGPAAMRSLFNLWPPFRGAGIRVREIADDFRSATVELRMRLLNRNAVGTHFGGSLFAMTDPFFMVMMMRNLGPEYIVPSVFNRAVAPAVADAVAQAAIAAGLARRDRTPQTFAPDSASS